jgi:3-oxoadipate enol-lactonase
MSFASIGGVTLHYRLTGPQDGSPLVLVNSLGTDLRIWDEVIARLATRHRILCYDKRGHGLSDAPAGPYGLDDHVGDLAGLLAHCGVKRAAICGISIGGMVAMRLATRHPGKVDSLVLCDTGPTIGTARMWDDRIARVRDEGLPALADELAGRWVSPAYPKLQPAAFAGWRNMLERCSPQGYVASCATVRDADLSAELSAIAAPTLVVVGANDLTTPPEVARRLADAIPHARLRELGDTGHVPAIEQPGKLAELIREHMNEVVHV